MCNRDGANFSCGSVTVKRTVVSLYSNTVVTVFTFKTQLCFSRYLRSLQELLKNFTCSCTCAPLHASLLNDCGYDADRSCIKTQRLVFFETYILSDALVHYCTLCLQQP